MKGSKLQKNVKKSDAELESKKIKASLESHLNDMKEMVLALEFGFDLDTDEWLVTESEINGFNLEMDLLNSWIPFINLLSGDQLKLAFNVLTLRQQACYDDGDSFLQIKEKYDSFMEKCKTDIASYRRFCDANAEGYPGTG